MFKNQYVNALLKIEEVVGQSDKFEFDMILDEYYSFSMSEVAAFYELLNIVELITAANGWKESSFQFRNGTYKISRTAGDHENIAIFRSKADDGDAIISEPELMKHINEKCIRKEQLYASHIQMLKDCET